MVTILTHPVNELITSLVMIFYSFAFGIYRVVELQVEFQTFYAVMYPYMLYSMLGAMIYTAFKKPLDRRVNARRRQNGEYLCDMFLFLYIFFALISPFTLPMLFLCTTKDRNDKG